MRRTPTSEERSWAMEVLGLPASATPRQVTSAYRRKLRTTHPDTRGDAGSSAAPRPEGETTQFADVVEAYRILTAPPRAGLPVRFIRGTQGRAVPGPESEPDRWPRTRPPLTAGPVRFVPAGHGASGGDEHG